MSWSNSSTWNLAWKSTSFLTPTNIPSNSLSKFSSLTEFISIFNIANSSEVYRLSIGLAFSSTTTKRTTLSIVKLTGSVEWLLRAMRVQFLVWYPWRTLDFFSFWAPHTSPCQWHCKGIPSQRAHPPVVPLGVQWLPAVGMSLAPKLSCKCKVVVLGGMTNVSLLVFIFSLSATKLGEVSNHLTFLASTELSSWFVGKERDLRRRKRCLWRRASDLARGVWGHAPRGNFEKWK